MRKISMLAAVYAAMLTTVYAAPQINVQFDDTKEYKVNESLIFNITVTDPDAEVKDGVLEVTSWNESTAAHPAKESLNYTAKDGAIYVTEVDRPGFVRLNFVLPDPDNKDGQPLSVKIVGAAVEPGEIVRSDARPEDFDQFWSAQLDRLNQVPLKELERVEYSLAGTKYADTLVCYDIKVSCVDDVPVSGYLLMPKNAGAKSLPAVVTYQGAGVYDSTKNFDIAEAGAMALCINAHGILNGQPLEYYQNLGNGELAGYFLRDINDRNKCYFTNMFLRVKRSLEYMKSLPEWDGENLFVGGGSQGGTQTIVAAALDDDVNFAAPQAPWMCYLSNKLTGRNFAGWPVWYTVDENGQPTDPEVVETLKYFDMVNFASRIDCEMYVTIGLVDDVCLPSGIMAMLAETESDDKSYQIFPNENHSGPQLYHTGNQKLIEKVKAVNAD